MTLEQQRDVLDKTHKMLTDFCGKKPRGSVSPWWETSREGVDLLLSYGIEYDHSMSHDDCHMYWLRTGDSWTKIDYKQKAETWMKPLVKGQETGLVEIPANWYLDEYAISLATKIESQDTNLIFQSSSHDVHQGQPQQPRLG